MKKFYNCLKNNFAQAMVEYILFILIMFAASYGMLKLFTLVWRHKFELISVTAGALSAIF